MTHNESKHVYTYIYIYVFIYSCDRLSFHLFYTWYNLRNKTECSRLKFTVIYIREGQCIYCDIHQGRSVYLLGCELNDQLLSVTL
jgi:hypothetical protein